jgi:GTP diphosphokinase / guanosine-3',5'-bis(diphosphate) 3'-diphosphatase
MKKIVAHYNLNNKEQLFSQVGMGLIDLKDMDQILKKKSKNKFIKYWDITFKRKDKQQNEPPEEPIEEPTVKFDKRKPFILKENP